MKYKIIAETNEILNFAEAEDKIIVVGSTKAVFGIKPHVIKSALIPC